MEGLYSHPVTLILCQKPYMKQYIKFWCDKKFFSVDFYIKQGRVRVDRGCDKKG